MTLATFHVCCLESNPAITAKAHLNRHTTARQDVRSKFHFKPPTKKTMATFVFVSVIFSNENFMDAHLSSHAAAQLLNLKTI